MSFVTLEGALYGALRRVSFRITIGIDIRRLSFLSPGKSRQTGTRRRKGRRGWYFPLKMSMYVCMHRYLNCAVKHKVDVIGAGSCLGLNFSDLLSQLLK